MKNFLIPIFTIIALTAFISCDDKETPTTPADLKDGKITSQTDPDLDPSDLGGSGGVSIEANITLSNTQAWNLTGALAVKSGFTLKIDAGTTINASVGGTNVYIVIEQGAKIDAVGTAAAPIKFTSVASNPRAGDWGGILINGFAKISGGGTSTTEVLPLTYGGTNDADNSGKMSFCIIEYTGARINGEKEFNGLTLYGVGSSTELNNIVIIEGDDDAIEWFGGTVSVTNLLVIDARDDLFDWTQGYRGKANSNWYGIRTNRVTAISEDTRGIEADGNLDGNSPSDADQSNPTINNVTIINAGTIAFADLVKIRRGSSATITGLYLGFGTLAASASDTIDLQDGKGNAASTTSITGTVNNVPTSTTAAVDIMDIKDTTPPSTITLTSGTTPSVDKAIFAWAGISF